MEWNDIRDLMWQGKPLFKEVSLGATSSRPDEKEYQGKSSWRPIKYDKLDITPCPIHSLDCSSHESTVSL